MYAKRNAIVESVDVLAFHVGERYFSFALIELRGTLAQTRIKTVNIELGVHSAFQAD